MNAAPAALSRAELANLSAAVASGTPAQLERIVAILDALPERGEADRVLDAARARLRGLRPARPLPLTRLLFVPLDGAIVPPAEWRVEEPTVPRSALVPLAALVLPRLQGEAVAIGPRLAGLQRSNHEAVARLGAPLWREAAGILAAAADPAEALPPGWFAAGLRAEDFPPLARLCADVLAHGAALYAAAREVAAGPPGPLARTVLQALLPAGRRPLAAGLATLLADAARPGAVSALAAGIAPAVAGRIEAGLGAAIGSRLDALQDASAEALAARVEALRDLLDDATGLAGRGPAWRRQVEAWRQAAEGMCRSHYAEAGRHRVLLPAERLAAGGATDAEAAALEEGALALRQLDLAARPLGHGGGCDTPRREALRRLRQLAATANPAGRVELARLAELLGGPEAGLELLEGAAPE
ncbi:hypothetical protein LPC08_16185 [Roseomonas sp. OT10]|uniref:hypothetical protein n=1 Tax=Roseomonas cutis TaxID=2897332 RepID=UPI001E3B452A|nr:hypothetical protein [Roseomonas sp. OT10]UFN47546.1 hypothetical protein LPC08_16185 [Roseomonas sp. OT10]